MSEITSEAEDFQQGRWTQEEHKKFLQGLLLYRRNWKSISNYIGTRSSKQVRSHAQKYFLKKKRNKNRYQPQIKADQQEKSFFDRQQIQLDYQQQINSLNQWYLNQLKQLLAYNTNLIQKIQQGLPAGDTESKLPSQEMESIEESN